MRVIGDSGNATGNWYTTLSMLSDNGSLVSAAEIADRLALPTVPTQIVYVGSVNVGEGGYMGIVASAFGKGGGALQFWFPVDVPTLLPGGSSVRLTNGTVDQLPPYKSFEADETGFTIMYESSNEDVMERRDPRTGYLLWFSFGPPYATVAPSGTEVLLPSGKKISTDLPVSNVRAYCGNFFVTTRSKGRDIKSALAIRRNIYYYSSDGILKWRIGEPAGRPPPQYNTVAVDANGDAWAIAGTQMFKARINLDTGDVFDLKGYK